ncbi:MAG: hypothetical protein FJ100_20340 [Deltaproteobacteria bacterium]|nr:hypothetical protein [Deltaproteobacteria bacterium]
MLSVRIAFAAITAFAAGLTAVDAHAQAAAAAAAGLDAGPAVKKKAKPSAFFPLTGSVALAPSVPGGAFVTGEGSRPGLDVTLTLTATYAIMPGLNLTATQNVNKNLVTNADSGASRPYDTSISDTILNLGWSPRVSDGKGGTKGFKLPGGIGMSLGLIGNIPVSRASKYIGRYTSLTPTLNLNKGGLLGGKLLLVGGIGFLNNFNRYTQSSVEPIGKDDVALAVTRTGGAEGLSNGNIATGANLTSYAVRWLGVANFQMSDRWSFGLTYLLFNGFRYFDAPQDQYTGKYARTGRGRVDTQWGIAALNYNFDAEGHWSGSLYTFTASPPFSADGKTYRFPFWDFRSTADNWSSVGLQVSHSF